jgi:hypothetical protein
MALFPPSGVLRGFPAATYVEYVSPKTLVRPCSTKKLLISEWDTQLYLHDSWIGTILYMFKKYHRPKIHFMFGVKLYV